jgi:dihydrolipoamide dehydrogenase
MRIIVPQFFAIGHIASQPMPTHKAVHEAHGHNRILGGGIAGTHAGDMIGEIALAIEMGAHAVDIGKTIHPHTTLGESIGIAAEVAHGSCTDLPPVRK